MFDSPYVGSVKTPRSSNPALTSRFVFKSAAKQACAAIHSTTAALIVLVTGGQVFKMLISLLPLDL
jgi:hypothetical protein